MHFTHKIARPGTLVTLAAVVAAAALIAVAMSLGPTHAGPAAPVDGDSDGRNAPGRIDVARFDGRGRLTVPGNLEEWVFIGSSLGMGYSQENFDPDSPGMFQVARIEPTAWAAFKDTGRFPDGTMIALHFYGSQNEISINRAGFVMDDLHFAEIHYKDSERFPDGFNFYNVANGERHATEIALPNDCVECHARDAAYDGVFVQFYPPTHAYLPDEVRESLARRAAHGDHATGAAATP